MNRNIFIFLLGISGIIDVFAQDTVLVSRQGLIEKINNNLQVQLSSSEVEISNGDLLQSRSLFLPSVTISHTAMVTNNPLMAFGSKLNQEVVGVEDFDPSRLNDPSRIDNYATDISILQPLINLDGINQRQAAKIQKEARVLQTERTKEYVEMELVKAYMQLQLTYMSIDVLKRAENTVNHAAKTIEDYFDQGLVQMSDVLAVKVRENEVENQLQEARSNVRNASDRLVFMIDDELGTGIYKPINLTFPVVDEFDPETELDDTRKDIMAMDLSVHGRERLLNSSRSTALPRLNAFGSYQLYDDNLFGMDAGGYLMGVQLSWNIFNGYKNIGKIEKAKAGLLKSKLENENYKAKSQLELNVAKRQLQDARDRVRLTKQAFEHSREAFRIRQDRFSEGLEKTTDYLMSETQMYKKELEHQQAIFEYHSTKELVRFLTR